MKNQVTKKSFLKWYLNSSDMIEFVGELASNMLLENGIATLTPEYLFQQCGYIPSNICVDQKNIDIEYDIDEVELID